MTNLAIIDGGIKKQETVEGDNEVELFLLKRLWVEHKITIPDMPCIRIAIANPTGVNTKPYWDWYLVGEPTESDCVFEGEFISFAIDRCLVQAFGVIHMELEECSGDKCMEFEGFQVGINIYSERIVRRCK